MGAGLCGYRGINPKVLIHLWNTFARPRMVCGLEAVPLTTEGQRQPEAVPQENIKVLYWPTL